MKNSWLDTHSRIGAARGACFNKKEPVLVLFSVHEQALSVRACPWVFAILLGFSETRLVEKIALGIEIDRRRAGKQNPSTQSTRIFRSRAVVGVGIEWYEEVWQTASLYHLVHTAALLAAPITKRPHIFGGLLTTGIVAFSGTCYTVALLENRKYSTLAPFGGFAFIAAWASLLF
ncbi:hypothetical protein NC652_033755 [Populus alba x Populus x berolinensis]|nr:hypothetical protein NC652_033755 [Populus alba x Populus x berolinensis]